MHYITLSWREHQTLKIEKYASKRTSSTLQGIKTVTQSKKICPLITSTSRNRNSQHNKAKSNFIDLCRMSLTDHSNTCKLYRFNGILAIFIVITFCGLFYSIIQFNEWLTVSEYNKRNSFKEWHSNGMCKKE